MRFVWLSLAVLLLVGCGRWAGATAARREVISERLESLRFPIGAEDASRQLLWQIATVTRCERLPRGGVRCGGCMHNRCFQLIEEQGLTRVVTKDPLSEADLIALWQPLDAASLAELRAELESRVQDKLIEQELAFVPRWGMTVGFLGGVSTDASSVGLGGRAGVRRWFDVHFVGHAAIEYRYRGDHELGFRVGLEVARWTGGRVWGAVGAPPASVSLFIGPMFRLPAFRGGLRTGVGFHVTDLSSAPFFVEFAAETTFAGEASKVVGTFTIGIGI